MSGSHVRIHEPLTIVKGSLSEDVSERLIDSTITGGVNAVTEITLELHDPAGLFLSKGLFEVGKTTFDWHIFKTTLAALEISGGTSGQGQIRAQFRSRWVRNLKQRRGPHSERNITPAQYVERECAAIGLECFVEHAKSFVRRQIARDVPKAGEPVQEGAEHPSAWTTFQRLAQEEGFLCFEYGGYLYFGTPEWCMTRRGADFGRVEWVNGRDAYRPLEMPVARRSEDATIPVEISLVLPRERYKDFRPGWRCQVNHFRGFEGAYIVNSLSYDLSRLKPLTMEIGTAVNPIPTGAGDQSQTERGVGKWAFIVNAAQAAGWAAENLQIAVAVALAESGGNPNAVSNVPGAGDVGNGHGLWQIDKRYHKFDVPLIFNPEYNAKFAYKIWKEYGGNAAAWARGWSAFRHGKHQKFMGEAAASIETNTSVGLDPGLATGPTLHGVPNPKAEADLSTRAIRVRRAVVAQFGEFTIGGWGTRGGRKTEHDDRDPRTGKKASNALDFMTYTDMKKGQAVCDFLAARVKELEIDYLIWNRRINSFDGRGWRPYTGPSPHTDHVHMTVNR